jgi:hypothetical protein
MKCFLANVFFKEEKQASCFIAILIPFTFLVFLQTKIYTTFTMLRIVILCLALITIEAQNFFLSSIPNFSYRQIISLYKIEQISEQVNATTNIKEGILDVIFTSGYLFNVTDVYQSIVVPRNCSGRFSPSTPIGYGTCSSRPYFKGNLTELCVCTNTSGISNMNACKASVDADLAANHQPPTLSQLFPNLTANITCADSQTFPSNYSMCNSAPPGYIYLATFNRSACVSFMATHTVMCQFGSMYGNTVMAGFSQYEAYMYLHDMIGSLQSFVVQQNQLSPNVLQSPTQVLLLYPISSSDYRCICLCTTSMCNINISTCTAGLPYDCTVSASMNGYTRKSLRLETV